MQDSGSTGLCIMSLYQQGSKFPADRSGKNVRLSPDKLRRETFKTYVFWADLKIKSCYDFMMIRILLLRIFRFFCRIQYRHLCHPYPVHTES